MSFLDKYRPVHAPKNEGAPSPDTPLENLNEYGLLLQSYVKKRRELHNYRNRTLKTYNDPEVHATSGIMNSEVHAWHGRLIEAGEKIGKGEYDVITDIFRQEGNLEGSGFGLPEFSLLTTDDIFMGHAGGERFVPKNGRVPRRSANADTNLVISSHEENRHFTKDDALIVFEVALYEGKGMHGDEWVLHAPDSYSRVHRARALAEKVGTSTRWFDDADPEHGFHAHSISLGGVTIKKKDIEYTASLIRDNPQLYRLGKEFYSPEEVEKNREGFIESLQTAFESMGKYGSHDQLAEEYLDRIKSVYGKESYELAVATHKEWYDKNKERLFLD